MGDKDYYAYFQWLTSMTNHKPEAFESLLRYYNKMTSYDGTNPSLYRTGFKIWMNLILLQQANLESSVGYAKIEIIYLLNSGPYYDNIVRA